MSDVYYRAYWSPDVDGIHVGFEEWISIHESPCFAYCVYGKTRRLMVTYAAESHGASALQAAKRLGIKVRRIDKAASRFAKPTKGLALNHMLFRQARRLRHLQRDTALIEALLNQVKVVDESENEIYDFTLPNTRDLVYKYMRFD